MTKNQHLHGDKARSKLIHSYRFGKKLTFTSKRLNKNFIIILSTLINDYPFRTYFSKPFRHTWEIVKLQRFIVIFHAKEKSLRKNNIHMSILNTVMMTILLDKI